MRFGSGGGGEGSGEAVGVRGTGGQGWGISDVTRRRKRSVALNIEERTNRKMISRILRNAYGLIGAIG
jgi:hypothetical protein